SALLLYHTRLSSGLAQYRPSELAFLYTRFTFCPTMTNSSRPQSTALYIGVAIVLLGLLTLDIQTPRGYADWILYIVAVGMCWFGSSRWAPVLTAAASTVLLVIGFVLSAENNLVQVATYNRVIG